MTQPEAILDRTFALNADEVREFLPHRDPFLFIDRVRKITLPEGVDLTQISAKSVAGIRVEALKNATISESFFRGHFPERAIMPGVLSLEVLAQTAAFSLYPFWDQRRRTNSDPKSLRVQCMLAGIKDARFRKPIVPGDQLRCETLVSKVRGEIGFYEGRIWVDDQLVTEAEFMANISIVDLNAGVRR